MSQVIHDGVTLFYEEAGSGGPPILLVHGWCCDHTYFGPQFEHFRRDRRVVSVDLRGHGQSDKPAQDYTIAAFAEDVAWVCQVLELVKPVIIGHSMGGVIALEMARRFPDLPAAVALLDAPIIIPQTLRERVRPFIEALRGPGYCEALRGYAEGLFLPTDDQERKARIVEGMSAAPQDVMVSALEGQLSWDGEAAAQACKVPVLNLTAVPRNNDLARLQALIPQLVSGQTVGAGHFHQLEVPEQANAMVDRFLAISMPKRVGA